jgi:hypothetical protein
MAALVLTPFLIAAAYAISWGMARPAYQRRSRVHLGLLFLAAASSLWYTISIVQWGFALKYWKGDSFAGGCAILFPGISAINYCLLATWTIRCGRPFDQQCREARYGFYGFLLSLEIKYAFACYYLSQNAVKPPPPADYGDCFVVGAAARGHPKLVGSWVHSQLGKPVNQQWYRFKNFEGLLSRRLPLLHRFLRRAYNAGAMCRARHAQSLGRRPCVSCPEALGMDA